MASKRGPLFSILLSFSCLLIHIPLSLCTDTISPSQPLSGNQTIVSKGGNFELGFFTPGKSHKHYIGIWYKRVSTQTVVWVANRENPLTNTSSSQLVISMDGNLVLLDHSKTPIWSTTSTPPAHNGTKAVLLDNGNLVLIHGSNSSDVVWQSFDHPTNTWLQGAKLGLDKVTRKNTLLTSWRSTEDPAPGAFSLGIDPDGSPQYITWWNGTNQYWTTGLWTGHIFSYLSEMIPSTVYTFNHVSNDKESYFTYTMRRENIVSGFVIDVDGQVQQSMWVNATQDWNPFWSQPRGRCQVYSVCGAFGVCDLSKTPFCSCLQGFEEASLHEWSLKDFSAGCVRKTPLQCGDGEKDGFLVMSVTQLPSDSRSQAVIGNADACKLACLNNCSCDAYSFHGECLMWSSGNLLNLRKASDEDTIGGTIFIRVAAVDLPTAPEGKKKSITGAVVGLVIATTIALIGFLSLLIWLLRRRRRIGEAKLVGGGSLVVYRYGYLKHVTKNFSEKLGGGGFGSVFRGVLPDSTLIAAKKLEGMRQGEKQFRAEVSTLGTIHHVNLVPLHGFCSEADNRLLVYEYMHKGSLDSHLFRGDSEPLDWSRRYRIALGTARGLAYLHEKCRDCIVHCDVKPENILLDDGFNPKVSDFGLAKLIGRDFSRALTTMRGTVGYLAPEWISGQPITPKADVYSFGMVLLEIISGKRNAEAREDGRVKYFPTWAASQLNEGEVFGLLDERLEGDADAEELTRAARVACWCIQDHETHRPSMSQVVQILEGSLEVGVPPVPRALQNLIEGLDDGTRFFFYGSSYYSFGNFI